VNSNRFRKNSSMPLSTSIKVMHSLTHPIQVMLDNVVALMVDILTMVVVMVAVMVVAVMVMERLCKTFCELPK